MSELAQIPGKSEPIVLHGARCSFGPRSTARASIQIDCGRVTHILRDPSSVLTVKAGCARLDLSGYLVMPGVPPMWRTTICSLLSSPDWGTRRIEITSNGVKTYTVGFQISSQSTARCRKTYVSGGVAYGIFYAESQRSAITMSFGESCREMISL